MLDAENRALRMAQTHRHPSFLAACGCCLERLKAPRTWRQVGRIDLLGLVVVARGELAGLGRY